MLKFFSRLKDYAYLRYAVAFNLFFILVCFLLPTLFWVKLPPEVPLFYSRPWGEEMLAAPFFLFIFPLTSFTVFLFNFFLVFKFLENKLLTAVLSYSSVLFSFLALFGIFKIILLVT